MEGWAGLGSTTVSKRSAQDRYMADITVVSCSNRHASLGNWSTEAELTTSRATSRDANHWVTLTALRYGTRCLGISQLHLHSQYSSQARVDAYDTTRPSSAKKQTPNSEVETFCRADNWTEASIVSKGLTHPLKLFASFTFHRPMRYNGKCKLHTNQAKGENSGGGREFGRQLYDTTPHYITNKRITMNYCLPNPPPSSPLGLICYFCVHVLDVY